MRFRVPAYLAAIVFLAGCFTAEVKLNADGSGTMVLDYDPLITTTEKGQRKRLTGPGITIEDLKLTSPEGTPGKTKVSTRLSFKDATKLSAAPHFSKLKVEIEDAGADQKRVKATLVTMRSTREWPFKDTCTIRVQLPGDLVETSAKAEGNTVVWSFPSADYFKKGTLEMTAVYKVAAAAPPPEAEGKKTEN
jgi:hypothetical protein